MEECSLHAHSLTLRPIERSDIPTLVAHERKVYPHKSSNDYYPTEDTFMDWFLRDTVHGCPVTHEFNRELAMVYTTQDGEMVAACVYMPLNRLGMQKLMSGEYNEVDIDPVHEMFRICRIADEDEMLFLHVYHVCWLKQPHGHGLFDRILRDTNDIICRWRMKAGLPIRVGAFSAYAVTSSGLSLFEHKLNCRERETYISKEHVLIKRSLDTGDEVDGDIIETDDNKEIYSWLQKGWEYRCRCRLVLTYPTEISLVWHIIDSGISQ